MVGFKALSVAVALVVGGAVAACEGRSETAARTGGDAAGAWWPGDLARPSARFGARRELAVLDLPQANAAGLDEAPADRTRVRLVVNRLASGSLLVKGNELPAGDDGVALLRLVVADFVRAARRGHDAGRGPWVGLLVRADRTCPFREVATLLAFARAEGEAVDRVDVGVAVWSAIDGRVELTPSEESPLGRDVVRCAWSAKGGVAAASYVLACDDVAWTFPGGSDPYARGDALAAANDAWRAFDARLRARPASAGSISLVVDPAVPWAYVAPTLALAARAGVRLALFAPPVGTFALSTPPREPTAPSLDASAAGDAGGSDGGRSWTLLGAGAAAGLAAAVAVVLATRARRRAPAR